MIALDHQDVIPSALLDDRAGRLDLRVQRIHQRDGALQIQTPQQAAARGNLIALVGHRFDSQSPPTARIDRADQLGALAATQGFAIQHHRLSVLSPQAGFWPIKLLGRAAPAPL